MDKEKELLDYETIMGAVAGEPASTEKVIAYYSDYIEELSTIEVKQEDGSVKKVVDEDLRQSIILKLLEEIPKFVAGEGYKE